MNTVSSHDGTTIAYDKVGEGPALILVDGALSVHSSGGKSELADLLAPRPCPVPVTETGHADADGDRAADFIAGSQWPLRGEILTHVDRLRTGLTADSIPREHRQARPAPRPIRLRAPRLRPPEQFLAVTRSLGPHSLGTRSLG